MAVDPVTPTTLYVATLDANTGGGLFKSIDAGASWTVISMDPTGPEVPLAVDPVTPTTVYAGKGYGGIFVLR